MRNLTSVDDETGSYSIGDLATEICEGYPELNPDLGGIGVSKLKTLRRKGH